MKFVNFFKDIFLYKDLNQYDFILSEENNDELPESKKEELFDEENVFPSLSVNLDYIKVKYNLLINSDVNLREFNITIKNKEYKSALLYIDGLIDTDSINNFILKPLMLRNPKNAAEEQNKLIKNALSNNMSVKRVKKFNLEDFIFNSLIPQNNVKKVQKFDDIISKINSGFCAIFVDTLNTVFCIETKGFKVRSIGKPENEVVVRGAQESFVENIRTNTSMLRRIINNENLIIEETTVGSVSKTKIAICYMQNITNESLVSEVKYRINNLKIDYIISSGQLEQLIEDNTHLPIPQTIATERPDRTSNYILEGRVAILINGSPYSLVVPGIFVDYLTSAEDLNLKYQYSNLLRIIRAIAFFFALFLPGLYVSITNFHQELIPSELLFAIAATRSAIPFPIIFEIIIMEVSFELIREARHKSSCSIWSSNWNYRCTGTSEKLL